MSVSKLLSIIVAGIYVLVPVIAYLVSHDQDDLKGILGILIFVPWPLALIWYGDELGDLIGIRYGLVSSTSPGWAVKFMGWVILLIPLIIGIVWFFIG